MKIEHFEYYIRLTADEGKYLHNGDTYTIEAYLPVNSYVEDWDEVTEIPEPQDEELSDSEALNIITQGI